MFIETNVFMAPVVNNMQVLSLIIKIAIPLSLLLWVYRRMKKATPKQLHHSNTIINAWLILYVLINISHIIWNILYIVTRLNM